VAAAPTPAAPAVPVEAPKLEPTKLEVKWDGVTVAPEVSAEFTKLAAELKLDSAGAQRFADLYANQLKASVAALEKADAANVEAVKAKYGAELPKQLELAKRAVDKFGGDALRAAINESGVGNHPAFVDLFISIGKSLAEDSVSGASAGGPASTSQEALLRGLFPRSQEMFGKEQ